jgi:hypothetical protein
LHDVLNLLALGSVRSTEDFRLVLANFLQIRQLETTLFLDFSGKLYLDRFRKSILGLVGVGPFAAGASVV